MLTSFKLGIRIHNMINFKYHKKAFSLIELLISLIVISLLVAAFAPLITKKLKAGDVTVGSFGKNAEGSLTTVTRNVKKEDCDKFGALYISAAMNDGVKPICVTKYNVGDNVGSGGVPIAGDVQKLNVGQTCTDIGNCCWKGHTASTTSGECTDDGNYSGCTRTVCNWKAANTSCNSYAPIGTIPGMWRLPKTEEMDGWANNISSLNHNKGKEGLMLCDYLSSVSGSVRCHYLRAGCPASASNYCHPCNIWSSKETETSGVYFIYVLNKGVFYPLQYSHTYAYSTRCVLDSIIDFEGKVEEPEPEIETREPISQTDCDKYNALFIDKSMNGGKTNVCAMKYNIGDVYTNPEVRVVNAGTTCSGKYCCWQGKTAGACNDTGNGDSTYSGCSRTLCNWKASDISCNTYAPDGIKGLWRLPTDEELEGWAGKLDKITKNQGSKGLQLCDADTSSMGSVQCNWIKNTCFNLVYVDCNPYYLWTSSKSEDSSNMYYDRALFRGVLESRVHDEAAAFSARCVTDKIPVK